MSTIGPIPKGADDGRSCPVACKVAPYRPRAFGQDGCRILRLGAILAPGRRMGASLLRIMGRAHERRFGNFHRVLDRAARSPHAGARILLGQAITPFAPRGPMGLSLADTIERRSGYPRGRTRPPATMGDPE